jgi:hypothetical protein
VVTQRQHDGSRVVEEHAQNGLPVLDAVHRGMPGQPSGGRLEAVEESCLALPRTSRTERRSSVGCTHGRYGSSASDRLTTENEDHAPHTAIATTPYMDSGPSRSALGRASATVSARSARLHIGMECGVR